MNTQNIVLASSSKYRQMMLKRLGLSFSCHSPDIDESRKENESPHDLALRLSKEKAIAVAQHLAQNNRNNYLTDIVIIGSDQVASIGNQVLGKPGTFEKAREQLQNQSGKSVVFHTAMTLIHGWNHEKHQPIHYYQASVPTTCAYRELNLQEIEHYLEQEKPFDTAGSAKAEGLGISLMKSMTSEDPTAIIGLPLIALSELLRKCGINPTSQGILTEV